MVAQNTKMKNIITTMGSPKLRLSSATGFMPPTSMSASNPAMLGQTMSIKIQPYSRPRKIPISLMPSAVNGSYRRQLTKAEHDQEAYQGVGVIGDFFVFARGRKWHDRFSSRGASVTGVFLPVGKKGGGRFPSSCEDGKRRVSKPGGRGGGGGIRRPWEASAS